MARPLRIEYDSPLCGTVASTILGSPEFVEEVMAGHLDSEPERSDVPAVRALHHRCSIENVAWKVRGEISDPDLARLLTVHICHLHTGAKLKEIGDYFGLSDSGVSKVSSRLKRKLETNSELREKIRTILSDLGRGKVQL